MRTFCTPACREGWREDRAHGLIYPAIVSHLIEGFAGLAYKSHYDWHIDNGTCPYCTAQVVKYRVKTRSFWRAWDGKPIDSAVVQS